MDWKLFWIGVLLLMALNGYLTTKKEEDDNAGVIASVKFVYLVGTSIVLYWFVTYLRG